MAHCAYAELYDAWMRHPEWWFCCSEQIDDCIAAKYSDLLDFQQAPSFDAPINVLVGYVIAMDQIPRHVFRNRHGSHIIEYFLQKAIACSYVLAGHEIQSTFAWCFAMLPIRHSEVQKQIYTRVMSMGWERYRRGLHKDDPDLMRRFMKATYQRCPKIQGGEHVSCVNVFGNEPFHAMQFSDILAYISDGLRGSKVPLLDLDSPHESPSQESPIIISLSGGVDSMVCSYLFSVVYKYQRIYAVHINYKNKPTCDRDEAFVTAWCKFLRIPLYVRRIHEVQRAMCMEHEYRDLYESYTRDVRYHTYKYVWRQVCPESDQSRPCVVLGHNKDDCFENILTNICKTQKYGDLRGMASFVIQDGINFWRPLLDVSKNSIKKYARDCGVPHLHDSTPSWSQRGKIRDTVVPTLNSWEPKFIPAMFELSDVLSGLYGMLDTIIRDWCERTRRSGHQEDIYTLNIPVTSPMLCNKAAWRSFLNVRFDMYVSRKSIATLVDRISKFQEYRMGNMKAQIKKGVQVTLDIDEGVCIFIDRGIC